MANHYDLLRDLFDIQVKNDIITKEALNVCLENYDKNIREQLTEYQILVEQNDDFAFNEPYFILFEFIHQQFKPLLPEEIEHFGQSIRTLFLKIKEGINEDKNILLERIEALSSQIRKFTNAVVNNTKSLLTESRELKANNKKIDYQEKIHKARYLIENYITPLNTILDVNHSQSIYNELLNVSQFTNVKRFDYGDESIRREFEKLYHLLRQVGKDLNTQSVILTNELLPLIERIKTESQYLRGFHFYLTNGNCYKGIEPPHIFVSTRDNIYNRFIYENTKEYFEQFKNEADIIIVEDSEQTNDWIFDKSKYKETLNSNLPVEDFFKWCESSIKEENEDFSFDNFFMVTCLLFEEDYEVSVNQEGEKIIVYNNDYELVMPKLIIKKQEDVSR
ncbi:hypothetical protein [Chryseobacterium sp. MDT2-18]|uniref:hypothetical protein n=1 Tax=Chryseobacterium sp. MDT2-18 TaxID=1259136 RepID=UPI0027D804C7|nr:hypothetical protein [Chryseobacterium sp. MDT2-18]